MLRYATAPIPSNNKNASANPAAIFRPNVHMSSLLRNAVAIAAFLNRFPNERNAHDRANHACRPRHMRDVCARHVLLLGSEELPRGDSQVALEVAQRQCEGLFGSAQNQPAALL